MTTTVPRSSECEMLKFSILRLKKVSIHGDFTTKDVRQMPEDLEDRGIRWKPVPASVSLILGSTKQESRWWMIMQVFGIQRIRDYLKVLAVKILDLIQVSVDSKHFDTKHHWLVEHSQQSCKYSEYKRDISNDCHTGGRSDFCQRPNLDCTMVTRYSSLRQTQQNQWLALERREDQLLIDDGRLCISSAPPQPQSRSHARSFQFILSSASLIDTVQCYQATDTNTYLEYSIYCFFIRILRKLTGPSNCLISEYTKSLRCTEYNVVPQGSIIT